jgi:hypothetical protein
MSIIFIDIETSPTINLEVIKRLRSKIHPPANYKNDDAIKKWWAINGEAKEKEVVNKTALDGLYGSIRCIGFAVDNEEPDVTTGSEKEQLIAFFKLLEDEKKSDGFVPDVVGHNVKDFDLKFIYHRAIVHNILTPELFTKHYLDRYSDYVQDTMRIWAGWNGTVSLENLAQGLLGKGKSGNGSDVFAMSDEECAEYCKDDVRLTREVFHKMTFNLRK